MKQGIVIPLPKIFIKLLTLKQESDIINYVQGYVINPQHQNRKERCLWQPSEKEATRIRYEFP